MKAPPDRRARAIANRRLVVVLIVACYGLLAAAWLFGNPPGAAPDEGDHYLRALSVASGDLRGRSNPELAGEPEALPKEAGPGELAALWLKKGSRLVSVPPGLAPVEWGCNAFKPYQDASCVLGHSAPAVRTDRLTTMGTVEPALYVAPGLAARLGDRPATALRLGRMANAVVDVALLGTAAALLVARGRTPMRLAGLTVAVTPMVLFVGSSLSPSGPEIAAAVCFFSAVLRIARQTGDRLCWGAAAVAGTILAVSRSLGPVWIVLMTLVVVAATGWRSCWQAVRQGGAAAWGSFALVTVAAASTAAWEAAFQPGVDFDGAYFREQLPPSVSDLPGVARDLVGSFGWLDSRMPGAAYALWGVMLAVLVVLALLRGNARERIVLCAVPVGVTIVAVAVSAGLLRQNGFGLQGRHVLGLAVVLPLLAADVVATRRGSLDRLRALPLLVGLAVPALLVHAVAWYANARRVAVGANGPVWFLGLSKWSPPGTWALWGAVVAVATCAGAVAAWLAPRVTDDDAMYAPAP